MDKRIEELEMEQTQKGFNQGYLIAKHKPELFKEIFNGLKKEPDNHYTSGFLSGGKQVEIEKTKEANKAKSKTLDKQAQTKQPTKTPTKGR